MTIIILALLGLLAIPLYFLLLLADGRELREKIREREGARFMAAPGELSPLIPSDHGSWLAHPCRMREDTPSAWPPL
jgi:hypothetical protein